jgi:hypothetical protein
MRGWRCRCGAYNAAADPQCEGCSAERLPRRRRAPARPPVADPRLQPWTPPEPPPAPTAEERAQIRAQLDRLYRDLGRRLHAERVVEPDRPVSARGLPAIDPGIRARVEEAARARVAALGYLPCDQHVTCEGGPCRLGRL